MKRILILAAYAAACVALAGCRISTESHYLVGRHSDKVEPDDVVQAAAYRKILPRELKLPPERVRVSPGLGITQVVVTGVQDEAQKEDLVTRIATLNAKQPFHPLQLSFE
jgi:outer membrane murein-binding lipoprotein Lpp